MTPLSTVNCFEDYHLGPSSSNMVFETELDHALSQIHKGPRTNMDKQDLRVSLSFLSQPFPNCSEASPSVRQPTLGAPLMDDPHTIASLLTDQTDQIFSAIRWRHFEDHHHRGWRNQSAARQKCPGKNDIRKKHAMGKGFV